MITAIEDRNINRMISRFKYINAIDSRTACVEGRANPLGEPLFPMADAFGNTISAAGSKVNELHNWLSSKYLDDETGFYYYGYRYYSPVLGRWLSRDPLGERGFNLIIVTVFDNSPQLGNDDMIGAGENVLYLISKNAPINEFDYLGLQAQSASLSWSCDLAYAGKKAMCTGRCKSKWMAIWVATCGCTDSDGNHNTGGWWVKKWALQDQFSMRCCFRKKGYIWDVEPRKFLKSWTESADCKCQPNPQAPEVGPNDNPEDLVGK